MAEFDPAKDAINLARLVDMKIRAVVAVEPFDYGKPRYRAFGFIDGVAYRLVFTTHDERYRPISLRRAHAKEMKRYVPES